MRNFNFYGKVYVFEFELYEGFLEALYEELRELYNSKDSKKYKYLKELFEEISRRLY